MNRLSALIALAGIAAGVSPAARQEPVPDPLEATVKAWADVKLWIKSGGQRTGWMRYRVRWGEYQGNRMVEVDVERATAGRYSGRFTAWLNPDKFLSPRALRFANNGYDWQNVDGRMGMFKKP